MPTEEVRQMNLLARALTEDPYALRAEGETEFRQGTREEAMGTHSGIGGVKEANFHTPRPWRYESDLFRKCGWQIAYLLDRLRGKRPTYVLPLDGSAYQAGKLIIFHSGTVIEKCADDETTTCSRAYSDPYPSRP